MKLRLFALAFCMGCMHAFRVTPAVGQTLVGYWPLDFDWESIEDESGRELYGSPPSWLDWPSYGAGPVGRALVFDGTTDHVVIPHDSVMDFQAGFSLAFWIKASPNQAGSDSQGISTIIDKSLGLNGETGWAVEAHTAYNGAITMAVAANNSTFSALVPAVLNNAWRHVAVTVAFEPTLHILGYVDGILVSDTSFPATTLSHNAGSLRFGRWWGEPARQFEGMLDEIRLYDGVLSPCVVEGIASTGGFADCNVNGIADTCEETCGPSVAAPTGVRFVSACAGAGGDGLTWSTAFCHLQDALAAAAISQGAITQLWVAQGVYRPDVGIGQAVGDVNARFELLDGVALYGGFACGDADFSNRDPISRPTYLSGDLLQNDGPNFTNIADNTIRIVSAQQVDASTVLDGFRIVGGGDGYNYSGSPFHGGGMRIVGGQPSIANCVFDRNCSARGAGISIESGANPRIDFSIFKRNRSMAESDFGDPGGAAALVNSASAYIHGCIFRQNQNFYLTPSTGSAALVALDANSVVISDSYFLNNSAFLGGAIYSQYTQSLAVMNSTFQSNYAWWGGAIYASGPSISIQHTRFYNNSALSIAAAVIASAAELEVANSVFSGNGWADEGPSVMILSSGGNGKSPSRLINCTIGNSQRHDWVDPSDPNYHPPPSVRISGTMDVTNTIIKGENDWLLVITPPGAVPVTISHSNLSWNWGYDWNYEPPLIGPGVINTNPLFADEDLRVSPASPCIDAGDPGYVADEKETDIDGRPRIMNCRIDLGAHESSHLGGLPNSGDMDADGATDLDDIRRFYLAIIHQPQSCVADVNSDGAANAADVQAFVDMLLDS